MWNWWRAEKPRILCCSCTVNECEWQCMYENCHKLSGWDLALKYSFTQSPFGYRLCQACVQLAHWGREPERWQNMQSMETDRTTRQTSGSHLVPSHLEGKSAPSLSITISAHGVESICKLIDFFSFLLCSSSLFGILFSRDEILATVIFGSLSILWTPMPSIPVAHGKESESSWLDNMHWLLSLEVEPKPRAPAFRDEPLDA